MANGTGVAGMADLVRKGEPMALDPASVDSAEGNREVTDALVAGLVDSIRESGQLVPGLVFPSTAPGRWTCADGHRRLACCRRLGLPFLALALPEAPTPEALLQARICIDAHFRKAGSGQSAADLHELRRLTGMSVTDLAASVGISQSQASKLLAPYENGCARLREALRDGVVCPSVGYLVAGLPHALQEQALERVAGRKRSAAERIIAAMRPGKPKGRAKPFRFACRGVSYSVGDPSPEAFRASLEAVSAALRKVAKEGLPLAVLPGLLEREEGR